MTRQPSLARRVAIASGSAAALGGAIAALVAGWTAQGLVAEHEDLALLAAAQELADEVLEELEDADDDDHEDAPPTLEQMLASELEDVRMAQPRAAIDDDGHVAGTPGLPSPPLGSCVAQTWRGDAVRACSVAMGDRRLTLVVSDARARAQRGLLMWAGLIGALVGALAGGLLSGIVTRWALAPLGALRDRVRRIRADEPRSEVLGERASHAELEELRAALADLVDRLGGSLSVARSFAAQAAHELRTPLTTIAGELELLDETEGTPDRAAVRRVRAQVGRLTSLVQRLLVLARPDRVDAAVAEAVDLGDALDRALEDLSPDERSRVRTMVDDDVLVRGDASLLVALLSNAVGNALKFSSEDVSVEIGARGTECTIDVRDRGPGVPAEERTRVFAPFYRSASARAGGSSGHGVGLALIAHVASAHGGTAELLDAPRGAHLRVRLPRWSVEPASGAGEC